MVLKSSKYYALILSTTILYSNLNYSEAADYIWQGQNSNDWNDATNWLPNGIPGANDNVFLLKKLEDSRILNAKNSSYTINNLTFSGADSADKPTLKIDNSIFTVNQDLVFDGTQSGGQITLSNAASLSVRGDLTSGKTQGSSSILINSKSHIYQTNLKSFILSDAAGTSTDFTLDNGSSADIADAILSNQGSTNLNVLYGSRFTARNIQFAKDALGNATGLVAAANSSLISDNEIILGVYGKANLTIADGAILYATGNITIAQYAGSEGVLNIVANTFDNIEEKIITPEIKFGSGTGTININTKKYTIDNKISGKGTINIINGFITINKNI